MGGWVNGVQGLGGCGRQWEGQGGQEGQSVCVRGVHGSCARAARPRRLPTCRPLDPRPGLPLSPAPCLPPPYLKDPELKEVMEDIEANGQGAMMKYMQVRGQGEGEGEVGRGRARWRRA